jgi:hypothetical protein
MFCQPIQPTFKIPEDYSREFVFKRGGFKCVIAVAADGIQIVDFGPADEKATSLCLDWIEESVGMIRKELDK